MKVLGLDISTKTGYAILQDGVLVDSGCMTKPTVSIGKLGYAEDFTAWAVASQVAALIMSTVESNNPDLIVIEQTNLGRSRSAQKQLEFIHCQVLDKIFHFGISTRVKYVDTSQWRSLLQIKLSKDQRKHNKAVKGKTARGKVTPKHLAVAWVNEKFGLDLLKKDHDEADAICLSWLGYITSLAESKPLTDAEIVRIIQPT